MWEDRITFAQYRNIEQAITSYRNGRMKDSQLTDILLKNGIFPSEVEEILDHEAEINKL